ncbi:MAG: cytochrome c1 [Azonexus sp.]|jgi:ubiquinol-cytochrome c reductase cytochrome c1 subunit|nr:cytochrome c1 [Azonexus sp.]
MKKLLIALLFAPLLAFAAGATVHLDKWPGSIKDQAALQHGAKLFVNYCLNCHSASFMRYSKLMDLGLTEQQVKDDYMYTADKIGSLMQVASRHDEQKVWFGVMPPDLTVVARARGEAGSPYIGADWLYTYLRSFYRDDNRPTGWNNVVFENVGMPFPLWQLQGQQTLNHETHKLELPAAGQMSTEEYDKAVSDLVGFMVWMSEPQQEFRHRLGWYVLAFLLVLLVPAYLLKKNYWKDVH